MTVFLPIRHHYSWLNRRLDERWLDRWHAKHMRDPEFVAAIEEFEPEYQRIREELHDETELLKL